MNEQQQVENMVNAVDMEFTPDGQTKVRQIATIINKIGESLTEHEFCQLVEAIDTIPDAILDMINAKFTQRFPHLMTTDGALDL